MCISKGRNKKIYRRKIRPYKEEKKEKYGSIRNRNKRRNKGKIRGKKWYSYKGKKDI